MYSVTSRCLCGIKSYRTPVDQRSAWGMTLAMWNMAKNWKPRLQSRWFTIVGFSYLQRASTDIAVDTSTDYRLRCWSNCQPTIGRPIYGRHSTAAVDRPIVDRCLVVTSPKYHRRNTKHTTEVSSTLVFYVVDTTDDCCQFWMFGGFSLLKCLLSVKSQREAKISWNLFASFSRRFPGLL